MKSEHAEIGTFLVVQWLRLHTSMAEGMSPIPGWGTINNIPHASRYCKKKKNVKKKKEQEVQPKENAHVTDTNLIPFLIK